MQSFGDNSNPINFNTSDATSFFIERRSSKKRLVTTNRKYWMYGTNLAKVSERLYWEERIWHERREYAGHSIIVWGM